MGNRGEKLNLSSLEEWQSQGNAPALDHTLELFNEIKSRGLQIFLISARREHLRSETTNNLVNVDIHGWTGLILRSDYSLYKVPTKEKRKYIWESFGLKLLSIWSHWETLVFCVQGT